MTWKMTTIQANHDLHDETSSGTVLTKRVRQEDPVPDADGNKRLRSSEIHPDTDEPSGSDDGATAAIISVPSHTTDLAPTSALVAPNVPPMDDNSNVTHTGLAQRSGHATASTSATESVHSLPFWSRAQYLEHLKATTEPASIGQSNSIVFGYAMKRALKFLQAKPAAKPKIYMDAQTDGALIVLRNLHRAGYVHLHRLPSLTDMQYVNQMPGRLPTLDRPQSDQEWGLVRLTQVCGHCRCNGVSDMVDISCGTARLTRQPSIPRFHCRRPKRDPMPNLDGLEGI
jgi:hypothetical protein